MNAQGLRVPKDPVCGRDVTGVYPTAFYSGCQKYVPFEHDSQDVDTLKGNMLKSPQFLVA